MTLLMWESGQDILYGLVASVLHKPCAPGSPEKDFLNVLALVPVVDIVFVLFYITFLQLQWVFDCALRMTRFAVLPLEAQAFVP